MTISAALSTLNTAYATTFLDAVAARQAARSPSETNYRKNDNVAARDLDQVIAAALDSALRPHWIDPAFIRITPPGDVPSLEDALARIDDELPVFPTAHGDLVSAAEAVIDAIEALGAELSGLQPSASTMIPEAFFTSLRSTFGTSNSYLVFGKFQDRA
jgi:hypothetical protein